VGCAVTVSSFAAAASGVVLTSEEPKKNPHQKKDSTENTTVDEEHAPDAPDLELVQVQVVTRHGLRTPLSGQKYLGSHEWSCKTGKEPHVR